MAKPKSKPQLSLYSAPVTDQAAGMGPEHWSRRFFEWIRCAFDDAQFADLYQEGGRYPVSPGLLACIMILQYMFRVSDRVAVEATIMRRDWRMALGLGDDWEGFDPSVLSYFRRRLGPAEQQQRIFNRVLEQMEGLGLLRGRRRVRVDATHVLADVARLNRADAIQEALRVVVEALYEGCPELRCDPEFERLYSMYGEAVWLGCGSQSDGRLVLLGQDGYRLLALCGARDVRGKATLERMLAENFVRSAGEALSPVPLEQRPSDHIESPHDPDARVGKKGSQVWVGEKVHLAETAETGETNVILQVRVTDPRIEDSTVLGEIVEGVRAVLPETDTILADGGYASASNSVALASDGLDLVSPPRPNTSRSQLAATEFAIDMAQQQARCPEGHTSTFWSPSGGTIRIRFPAAACAACPRRAECTTSPQGRSLNISLQYDQLQRDRARAADPAFRILYRLRAGIEATFSQLVHRCGLRRNRYRGAPRRKLHIVLAATALNVWRLLQWAAA
jgi:IS5 family transposase